MADQAWKDFVIAIPNVAVLTGSEKFAALDSDGEKGSVTPDMLKGYIGDSILIHRKISFTPFDIANSYTAHLILVPAPGIGKIIYPISVEYRKNFVSGAWATNVHVEFGVNTIFSSGNIFNFWSWTSTTIGSIFIGYGEMSMGAAHGDNYPLSLRTISGNPTSGNGGIDFYISYYVLTL